MPCKSLDHDNNCFICYANSFCTKLPFIIIKLFAHITSATGGTFKENNAQSNQRKICAYASTKLMIWTITFEWSRPRPGHLFNEIQFYPEVYQGLNYIDIQNKYTDTVYTYIYFIMQQFWLFWTRIAIDWDGLGLGCKNMSFCLLGTLSHSFHKVSHIWHMVVHKLLTKVHWRLDLETTDNVYVHGAQTR